MVARANYVHILDPRSNYLCGLFDVQRQASDVNGD